MIIVSQDKTMVINFENVEIIGVGNPLENDLGKFPIVITTISDNEYPIAIYETEERAKEVLQEIVERYEGWQNLVYGQPSGICNPRYEIPKE